MFGLFVYGISRFERLKSTRTISVEAWLSPFKFVYILYCPMENFEHSIGLRILFVHPLLTDSIQIVNHWNNLTYGLCYTKSLLGSIKATANDLHPVRQLYKLFSNSLNSTADKELCGQSIIRWKLFKMIHLNGKRETKETKREMEK